MTITAKYAGTCKGCGGRISEGERIIWARGRGSRHVDCDTQQPPAPKSDDSKRAPTDPQIALLAKLKGASFVEVAELAHDTNMTMVEASELIDKLITAERAAKATLPDETVVPAGRYALEIDGELRFVKVWRKGRRVNVYDDDEYGVTLPPATLQAIADAGAFACATRYGQLRARCSRCGIKLKNRLSVELAIGPECIKHFHDDVTRLEMVQTARDAIRARGLDPKETV
jgi:hypothetical protein